jgi:hypothetical protein
MSLVALMRPTGHGLTWDERVARSTWIESMIGGAWRKPSQLLLIRQLSSESLFLLLSSASAFAAAAFAVDRHARLGDLDGALRMRPECVSPNGIVHPRARSQRQYVELVRAVLRVLADVGLGANLASLSRVNLRVRGASGVLAWISDEATVPHSDIWAGEFPNSHHLFCLLTSSGLGAWDVLL